MFARHRGLLTAIAVFLLLFALVNSIGAGRLTYFDIGFMASGAATLAIAAIGEVDEPLATLPESRVRPPKSVLDDVMQRMR